MKTSDVIAIATDAWNEGREEEASRILAEIEPQLSLRRGDCIAGLRTLADKSVDVTITDPPYEAEAHTEMRRQLGKTRVPGANEKYRGVNENPLAFAPITPEVRTAVAIEIARTTRHCALVFGQVESVIAWRDAFAPTAFAYRRTVPWTKPDAMPSLHGRWPGQAFEALFLFVRRKGARPCPVGGKSLFYNFTREKQIGNVGAPHPTTKPLALMRAIVEDFTVPGDVVCDPFAGSGTTGVACKMLNRDFVGWELDNTHYLTALRRLNGEEAKPRAAQPSLFAGGIA